MGRRPRGGTEGRARAARGAGAEPVPAWELGRVQHPRASASPRPGQRGQAEVWVRDPGCPSRVAYANARIFCNCLSSLPRAESSHLTYPPPPHPGPSTHPRDPHTSSPCCKVRVGRNAAPLPGAPAAPRLGTCGRGCECRGWKGASHLAERICARGRAPGGAAHGQILAFLTVAAAFRTTRRRHNLGAQSPGQPMLEGRPSLEVPPGR